MIGLNPLLFQIDSVIKFNLISQLSIVAYPAPLVPYRDPGQIRRAYRDRRRG